MDLRSLTGVAAHTGSYSDKECTHMKSIVVIINDAPYGNERRLVKKFKRDHAASRS